MRLLDYLNESTSIYSGNSVITPVFYRGDSYLDKSEISYLYTSDSVMSDFMSISQFGDFARYFNSRDGRKILEDENSLEVFIENNFIPDFRIITNSRHEFIVAFDDKRKTRIIFKARRKKNIKDFIRAVNNKGDHIDNVNVEFKAGTLKVGIHRVFKTYGDSYEGDTERYELVHRYNPNEEDIYVVKKASDDLDEKILRRLGLWYVNEPQYVGFDENTNSRYYTDTGIYDIKPKKIIIEVRTDYD